MCVFDRALGQLAFTSVTWSAYLSIIGKGTYPSMHMPMTILGLDPPAHERHIEHTKFTTSRHLCKSSAPTLLLLQLQRTLSFHILTKPLP